MTRLVSLVMLVVACARSPGAVAPTGEGDLVIARHADAVRGANRVTTMSLPFGQGQSGGQVLLALLDRARRAGAAAVADVTFHLVFRWHGTLVDCETRAAFADDPALAASVDAAALAPPSSSPYSTEVASFAPRPLEVTRDESDVACRQVPVEVEERVRRYASRFDADVPRDIDAIPTETASRAVRVDACALARVTRRVVRYDYELALGYVPPDWRYFAARFAREPLVATPPLCFQIDASELGPHPTHRLTATVSFRGPVEQLEPVDSPIGDVAKGIAAEVTAGRASKRR